MSKKPISRQKVEDTEIAEQDTTLFKQEQPVEYIDFLKELGNK